MAVTLARTLLSGPPNVGVRPVTVTSTTGVPLATTASSNCSCPPGRSSESRSPHSELVCTSSPSTTTATSLALHDRRSARPCQCTEWPAMKLNSAGCTGDSLHGHRHSLSYKKRASPAARRPPCSSPCTHLACTHARAARHRTIFPGPTPLDTQEK
eukprot:COSAG03_NODE_1436_length_4077_cov_8.907561_4_plen_156_part_00